VQITFGPSTPSYEVGVRLDVIGALAETPSFGAHLSKRMHDWLYVEGSYDWKNWSSLDRRARMAIGSVRLQTAGAVLGKRAFVTAGAAAAQNLSFRWSPMASAGVTAEAPDGIISFRGEVQWFARGTTSRDRNQTPEYPREPFQYDRYRLLLGISIGIP
jgi:hypothetical protein